MKIVRLTAEDILRLKAVDITPDPAANTVVISGKNGAGKSSVLNAIWLALGGGEAGRALPEPVRKGAKKGVVTVDLGGILVTKKFTAKGGSLEVTNAEGFAYPSPQAMLDKLIGSLSFDPLAFANAKPREQLATLMEALGIDLQAFEMKRTSLYNERTAVNREVKTLTAQWQNLPTPPRDTPTELVSVKDLMTELDTNRSLRDRQAELQRQQQKATHEIDSANEEIERLSASIVRWQDKWQAAEDESAGITYLDPNIFVKQIEQADAINNNVRILQRRVELTEAIDYAQMKSEALTDKLSQIETEKARAIERADLPVEGLGFSENGVTMHDVPFEQASSAEQLRVSLAIAMAMNPELRVIRVTDGSLLDGDSMRIIEDMAKAEDFQVWVEVVSDAPLGVHIEEGVVEPPALAEPPLTIISPKVSEKMSDSNDLLSGLDFGDE